MHSGGTQHDLENGPQTKVGKISEKMNLSLGAIHELRAGSAVRWKNMRPLAGLGTRPRKASCKDGTGE
jgi:hypothetical protein